MSCLAYPKKPNSYEDAMVMLSEEEKKELKSLAGSPAIRDEFRQLRRAAIQGPPNVDRLLSFLTTMARLRPEPSRPRPFVHYTVVKI